MNSHTAAVLEIFERWKMPGTQIDEWGKGGRDALVEKIEGFTANNWQIRFFMLGFPFKSSNTRDKTLGEVADFAEEASMAHFRDIGRQMAAVYPPGVKVDMVSDGFVFNDLIGIPDETTETYLEGVKALAADTPFEFHDLRDFYGGTAKLPWARQRVVEQMGIDETELQRRLLFDPNVNHLWLSISHFMFEEISHRYFESNRAHKKAARELARNVIFRNEAYSALAASQFKSSIRLTMHASTNNGKYGIQMFPTPHAWTSPWHCALLVRADGALETVHRKDAVAAGHELVVLGGRPHHFQEVK